MFETPVTIGRYKVLGELGRGSMGVVYLAEDPVLKREVAIKLVHRGAATQTAVLARFRQEAEISARLNHPNVIMVFDVGEEKELGPFMAMEFADGEVLSDILARGPMEAKDAAGILIQGYHALRAAHAKGIIHRDFKPENLILTAAGRLKLMDFGIARHENPGLTGSGVLCTPSFAAPEILDQRPPSAITDNWAFCVTAFQMITGQLPFRTGSISSLLYAIAYEPPVFPEAFPDALAAVFSKALEKAPKDRYADLQPFMEDLLEALPLEPAERNRCVTLLATPEATAGRALERPRFLPGWLGWSKAVWMVSALVVLGALGWLLLRHQSTRKLTLSSYPPEVRVFLDDKPLGTTPLLDIKIPPKARVLRLEKDGYQSLERSLRPQDQMLTLTLTARPISLNIQSDPAGAEVFVNSVLMGVTPIQGLQVPGDRSHRVQLRKAGYEPWNGTVARGEELPGLIRLRKLQPPKKSFWKRFFSAK